MIRLLIAQALLLAATTAAAQEKSFTVNGRVPLPDGYRAGIVVNTDTAYSVSLGDEAYIKDGRFTITGRMTQPQHGTLMTNNLELVERNHWPTDSIRWTYTPIFMTPGELLFTEADIDDESPFALTGTPVQADYNELRRQGGERSADPWAFIDAHPRSVISVWLANKLLERGYNLTAEQVSHLEQTIGESPADPQRYEKFKKQIAAAKKTVKNAPVTDLELTDTLGAVCHLTDILPHGNGKFVLIDFWASWCGICLHSMPDVKQLTEEYADRLDVVGVSIDTKADAWHKARAKHPEMTWPQYCTTKTGYQDLFDKYQVGNGVPYYLLVSPEGRVVCSPEHPGDIKPYLEHHDKQ